MGHWQTEEGGMEGRGISEWGRDKRVWDTTNRHSRQLDYLSVVYGRPAVLCVGAYLLSSV